MKRKYPEEESEQLLPFVAIALFLINNGCDWDKKNKSERTAANRIPSCGRTNSVTEILRSEGHRYYLMNKLKSMPLSQKKTTTLEPVDENSDLQSRALYSDRTGKII